MAKSFERSARSASGIADGDLFAAMAYPPDPPFAASTLWPTVPCEFEGGSYPVPHDVETYLKTWYGPSYMEMPPLELRTNHAPMVLDFGEGPVDPHGKNGGWR